MALEQELAFYEKYLGEILADGANEGKFTVIKGQRVLGVFDDYDAALEAGYREFGPGPFLVKQICRPEPIFFFARDLP